MSTRSLEYGESAQAPCVPGLADQSRVVRTWTTDSESAPIKKSIDGKPGPKLIWRTHPVRAEVELGKMLLTLLHFNSNDKGHPNTESPGYASSPDDPAGS